jgi:hypothetical protein
MFGQRPVAGFAIHVSVLACAFFLDDICVAIFAGAVTGEVHRASGSFGHRVSTVMAVLTEALWNQIGAHPKKSGTAHRENGGQS